MISGATEQELEIANARAELLLEIKEKDKEIERLCNALNEVIERNSKAIEFIEEELTFYITIGGTDERKLIGYNKAFDELLKILKGDSSNE